MTTGSIVLDTCREHDVTIEDFFSRRRRADLVACRLEAISRLRAAGFSNAGIARMMRRHGDTIRYWTSPGLRARRQKTMLKRYYDRQERAAA